MILAVAYAIYAKRETAANVADYLFFGGPYLSRTLSYSAVPLEPDSAELAHIISDIEYEDRHWYRLELDGAIRALTLRSDIDPSLIKSVREFVSDYRSIRDRHQGPQLSRSDGVVREIVGLVHRFYLRHKHKGENNNTRELLAWPFHAENHLINLATTTTACGTTGEATLALLRDAGFKTRLLGVSNSPQSIVYSHVFLEYYSWENNKWVMLDPMINEVVKDNKVLLSAFEFIQNRISRKTHNEKWEQDGEYSDVTENSPLFRSRSIIFFSNDLGPLKTTYYFSDDADIRDEVSERVLRENYRPDWI